MSQRILILGAAGRLGRAAAEAFRDAGWTVESQVRGRSVGNVAPGTRVVEVDAFDAPSLVDAVGDADVVLHALNPPFTEWPVVVPHFADVAIAIARRSNATLMFAGNLYNYGSPLPPVIDEATPMRPSSRKGKLRLDVEQRMREASEQGLRTIVLRAGDFFGGAGRGSWFDRMIAKDVPLGRATYPGPLNLMHEWAYLPDFAASMVRLAEVRAKLPPFAAYGFAGHAVNGQQLIDTIARAAGRPISISKLPWFMLRLLGPFVPIFGELAEMAYLWQQPHRIDGTSLKTAIGTVPHTPFTTAVTAALDELGLLAARRTQAAR